MKQIDLFSLTSTPLPDEQELGRRYAKFNQRHFASSLPAATIRWSRRMRVAGTCDHQRRIITLSRIYHSHFPDDVDDTLKHEMIHLRHRRHDAAFRREAARVGASVHCREYPELHPRARFVYVCPSCGTEFPRSRRERLYCGRCARRRLDPRYELVLRSHVAHERAVRSLAAKRSSRQRVKSIRRRRLTSDSTERLL